MKSGVKNRIVNIGIIWANPYTGNLGVTALAFSTLFLLEKISDSKDVNFRYFILCSNGPKHDRFLIDKYAIKTENLFWTYNGSFKSLIKLLLINVRQVLGLLKLDYALDIGAGDSFSDIYGIKRFREIYGIKKILKFLGKKLVLLPQTFGPYDSPEAKRKAIKIIKKSDLVLARDSQSFSYINKIIPNIAIAESIDVAFFLPFIKSKINSSGNTKIGINISGLLWNGGYTKDNQFHLQSNYRELMQDIIADFLGKPDIELYLVAHVLLSDYDNIENDYKVCEELNLFHPTTFLAPNFTNPIDAKTFIGGLDFFIGARMHSCIAAFSAGVPVFPLGYSRKFSGLFGESLQYKYYGDLVNKNNQELIKELQTTYLKRKEIKEEITNSNILLLRKESELINILSNVLQ